jgi:hypothetical protein
MDSNLNQTVIMKKFHDLCAIASRAEDEELDKFLEREYSAVLDYILSYPQYRPEFGTNLLNMVEYPGDISDQLVEYCMYELKWHEVEENARLRLSAAEDPRSKIIFEHILEAFQDDWDKEGYERWNVSTPKNL